MGLAFGVSESKAQDITVETRFAYESEYVFRGIQLASESFQPTIDLGYDDFYLGLWSNLPIEDGSSNEIDYYGGYSFEATDLITADIGATVYHYPDTAGDNDTLETFVGFAFDTIASPEVYVFYDYDLRTWTLESSVSHSVTVNENSFVELGLSLGYVDAGAPAGLGVSDYYYYGASADWIYRLSDSAQLAIGVRGSGNDEDLGPGGRDANFWGGLSFTAGF